MTSHNGRAHSAQARQDSIWRHPAPIKRMLLADGWRSPDTYCNAYADVPDGAAVYLFLLHKTECYDEALIAYVGMSMDLPQRLCGHEVMREIKRPGFWPMRWFKQAAPETLRETEADYIRRFNPPWNIVGKVRGVPM